ncbi:MAG: hypothetical protein RI932_707 [Pseudomonadota bacterium]
MKPIERHCDIQFLVCVNERPGSNPLPSCGAERGNAFFNFFRSAAVSWGARHGLQVWVNRSLCQGFCDKDGVSVAAFPQQKRWNAVTEADVPEILRIIEENL